MAYKREMLPLVPFGTFEISQFQPMPLHEHHRSMLHFNFCRRPSFMGELCPACVVCSWMQSSSGVPRSTMNAHRRVMGKANIGPIMNDPSPAHRVAAYHHMVEKAVSPIMTRVGPGRGKSESIPTPRNAGRNSCTAQEGTSLISLCRSNSSTLCRPCVALVGIVSFIVDRDGGRAEPA